MKVYIIEICFSDGVRHIVDVFVDEDAARKCLSYFASTGTYTVMTVKVVKDSFDAPT